MITLLEIWDWRALFTVVSTIRNKDVFHYVVDVDIELCKIKVILDVDQQVNTIQSSIVKQVP